jgi:hypothetical protein
VKAQTQEWTLCKGLNGESRQYLLYFPDYEVMDSLFIGIDSGAVLHSPAINHFADRKPVVIYGTSIVQGAAASKPGMAYPAQIERMLQRETINLGFSGNGQLDTVIAHAIAARDASCYVIDCGPNLSPALAAGRTYPFLQMLKKRRPEVPVLLVENLIYPTARFDTTIALKISETNRAFRAAFDRLQQEGVGGLYYIKAEELTHGDGEGFVDGIHLTDLGFYRIAVALAGKLSVILQQENRGKK